MADHLDRRVETTEVNLVVDPGKRKQAELLMSAEESLFDPPK
jgi:hypothetical protein